MTILTMNRAELEKKVGKITKEIENKISMMGTPIESVTSDEVAVEIFPNRPDLLSLQGFSRALLQNLGKKGVAKFKIEKPEKDYVVEIDKSVKEVRPYTVCAIVKNLKFDDEKIKEIIDIQEKLHLTLGRDRKKIAIGIYPLEKIKLPIRYLAKKPDEIKFMPLEMNKELTGAQILRQHPTGRDYAHLLKDAEVFPIFIDADDKILSMPPIINSHETGKISEKTKDVFIECSGFDLEILKKCLNIIVTGLADMGGRIYQMQVKGIKTKTPNLSTEKMPISLENTNKLLGLNLTEKQLKPLLEKMGYNYDKKIVEIPAWRTDILHEVDLIEDVAIAYGYENFKPEIPSISTIGEEDSKETLKKKISEILIGLKMLEVSNYHLTNKEDQFIKMGIPEKKEKNFIEVEKSKTDYTILRKDLSHYLLKNLSENIDSEYPQKIFEIGKVFEWQNEQSKEEEHLCLTIAPGNFTETKQVLEYLFKMIDLEHNLEEIEIHESHFITGRVAEITFNKQKIGYLGEVHPKILNNWKIKMPVSLFEINLEGIFGKLV